MILLLHIFIAVLSVVLASIALARPTRHLLTLSYGMVGATIATGVTLVVIAPVSMLHLCISGLVYTIITLAILTMARQKLASRLLLAEEAGDTDA